MAAGNFKLYDITYKTRCIYKKETIVQQQYFHHRNLSYFMHYLFMKQHFLKKKFSCMVL